MDDLEVKQQVRQFYDQVGWQVVSEGMYQNARYEDLRPVSREYIQRCHQRVSQHLKPAGTFLLDAGSGPVQYPEYLAYSAGYRYRVCVDISSVALQEARKRLGQKGLYVVADVAHLPFQAEAFEGAVSLHTLHHLPAEDHPRAYAEIYRMLKPGCQAVVVNGWTDSPLMRRVDWLVRLVEKLQAWRAGGRGSKVEEPAPRDSRGSSFATSGVKPVGTFIQKFDPAWLKRQLAGSIPYSIYCWRSVNVRFLRALIHPWLGGRLWLRLQYWLEERNPRFYGEVGQYPLIVLSKPGGNFISQPSNG